MKPHFKLYHFKKVRLHLGEIPRSFVWQGAPDENGIDWDILEDAEFERYTRERDNASDPWFIFTLFRPREPELH